MKTKKLILLLVSLIFFIVLYLVIKSSVFFNPLLYIFEK